MRNRVAENEVRIDYELDELSAELAMFKHSLFEKELWIREMSSVLKEVRLEIRLKSAKVEVQQFMLEKL